MLYCVIRTMRKLTSRYYIDQLYVESLHQSPTELGIVNSEEYKRIYTEVFGDTELSNPIIMKIGTEHIRLEADKNIPIGTVKLKTETIEELSIQQTPSLEQVLYPTEKALKLFNNLGFFP